MFEFYYTKVFSGVQDDAFGWLWKILPIFTLLLGIGVQRLITVRDQRNKERKAANDLITEIQLIDEPARKQVEAIDKFIKEQSVRKVTIPVLSAHSALNLERLKAIDRTAVVEHLTRMSGDRKEALRLANKLFSGCDLVTGYYGELESMFEEYKRRGTEYHSIWQKHLNEWQRAVDAIVVEAEKEEKNLGDDTFIVGIVNLLNMVHDNKEKDLYFFLENLHDPHIVLTGEHRKDDRILDVAHLNAQARFAILEFDSLREEMVTRFKRLSKNLSSETDSLLTTAREMEVSGKGKQMKVQSKKA
jgi:hypothetical protein